MTHVKSIAEDSLIPSQLVQIKKLQSDRTYRETSQTFYIEGVRNFIWGMDNQLQFTKIVYSEKLLMAPTARKLVRQARRNGMLQG